MSIKCNLHTRERLLYITIKVWKIYNGKIDNFCFVIESGFYVMTKILIDLRKNIVEFCLKGDLLNSLISFITNIQH